MGDIVIRVFVDLCTVENSFEDTCTLHTASNLIKYKIGTLIYILLICRCEEDVFSKFCILDARGKVAATLNMAVGKGTEDVSQYQNAELIFCNIDNIHVMRTSAAAMADALSSSAAQAMG